MKPNVQSIQAIASDMLGANCLANVIEKTSYLFRSIEVSNLTQLINNLLLYTGNPDLAQELTKQEFANLTCDSLSLVNMLVDLNEFNTDLENHVKQHGHE